FILAIASPATSSLFPYTTLFRSRWRLPAVRIRQRPGRPPADRRQRVGQPAEYAALRLHTGRPGRADRALTAPRGRRPAVREGVKDRKSTRLNSSHVAISYAVFCL